MKVMLRCEVDACITPDNLPKSATLPASKASRLIQQMPWQTHCPHLKSLVDLPH